MGGCFSYRLKLVREYDEFPNAAQTNLFRKVTHFSFKSLKTATNNFDSTGVIGMSGFAKSYKGILDNGSEVVVMVYSDYLGIEFNSIISIMSGAKHNNVVELIGYCIEGDHRILVHEFVGESSLDQMLFSDAVVLDWPTRVFVCHGIAHGLDYLHNGISPRVVRCEIKPSNILMDCSFNPKIRGFDLSRLLKEGESHYSGTVAGTFGYIDPDVFATGRFSEKTDVYSFGISLLEIVTGYRNTLFAMDHEGTVLAEWAWELRESSRISEIVDEKLSEFSEDEVKRLISIALSCVQGPLDLRPSMSDIRMMLSDNYDYSRIILTAPNIPGAIQQEQMSSDSEVSESF